MFSKISKFLGHREELLKNNFFPYLEMNRWPLSCTDSERANFQVASYLFLILLLLWSVRHGTRAGKMMSCNCFFFLRWAKFRLRCFCSSFIFLSILIFYGISKIILFPWTDGFFRKLNDINMEIWAELMSRIIIEENNHGTISIVYWLCSRLFACTIYWRKTRFNN